MGDRLRDERGRFKQGGPPGPGRKSAATEEEYARVFHQVVPPDRFAFLLEAVVKRAERGDVQAFKAIADRLVPEIKRTETEGEIVIEVRYVRQGHTYHDDGATSQPGTH